MFQTSERKRKTGTGGKRPKPAATVGSSGCWQDCQLTHTCTSQRKTVPHWRSKSVEPTSTKTCLISMHYRFEGLTVENKREPSTGEIEKESQVIRKGPTCLSTGWTRSNRATRSTLSEYPVLGLERALAKIEALDATARTHTIERPYQLSYF